MQQPIADLIRIYKGCAWAVLSLLMFEQQPMSAELLERKSGYSDKAVHKALLTLEEDQRITRNGRYAWQIAGGFAQLPIMAPELDPGSVPEQPVDKPVDNFGPEPGFPPGTRNNSESEIPGPLASSRSTNLDLKQENLLPASYADPEKFRVANNLAELDAQRIHEPARSKLANLAHVTPELIRAHCAACKNLGQAIYRIEHNWAIPIANIPVSVITVYQQSDCIIDDQAENWWSTITDQLREQVPKAIFDNYFPVDSPARQVGEELVVLVPNTSFAERVDAGELDRLAEEISVGKVNSIRFVTQWEQS